MTMNREAAARVGPEPGQANLSARVAKALVGDLFELKPAFYWLDLILSSTVAYAAAAVYLRAPTLSLVQLLGLFISGVAFFRIATFMHEIAHMRRDRMRLFKFGWNILVGIPLLTPSLFYTSHADHHSNRHYGTADDGEYLPFGATPPMVIVQFLCTIPFVPVLAVFRALVLVPLSFGLPRLRVWLLENASAAVISPSYKRRHVPSRWEPIWLICDLACFGYALAVSVLVARGVIDATVIGKLYLLITFSITLNWFRTLAAHRYRSRGDELSHAGQVLDSINITGNPILTAFLFPVGLRYHALHHLLPSLPYHALGQAHRRLMENLPAESSYRETNSPSMFAALNQLWSDASRYRAATGAPAGKSSR
ncbi:MAG: fatty acid desaturase [Gammaproteobacteria bacterium]|jgi:fatty acid desaturase